MCASSPACPFAIVPLSEFLRPLLVRPDRQRLIRPEILRADRCQDEVLRRNRVPGKPPQHRQLPGMSHRICKRPLQHHLRRNALKLSPSLKMPGQILHHRMKIRNRRTELRMNPRPVAPSNKVSPRIPKNAAHMTNQLVRRAPLHPSLKTRKLRRRIAKRLLRPVRQSPQKMSQHCPLVAHPTPPTNRRESCSTVCPG